MLKFLRCGDWTSTEVSVGWLPGTRRIMPEVEAAIDQAWATALARPGVHLFDGPMCRLESWSADDHHLQLNLSESSYRIFLGTNMANIQFARELGAEVMGNPLGISTLLMTSDNRLLLGQRTSAVAYHPGRIHPFAGCMEPGDADPFVTANRELTEELSLSSRDTTELRCIGLMESLDLQQPELIFWCRTSLRQSELESQLDRVEHRSIWSIPATSDAIEQSIREIRQLTPVAVGTLLLWGRLNIGQNWFAENYASIAS